MKAIDVHSHIPTEEGPRPFAHFQAATSAHYRMSDCKQAMPAADFMHMIIDWDVIVAVLY